MAKQEVVVLNDREEAFISILLENGGNLRQAAEDAGYNRDYAYALRKRLNRAIADAAKEYMALNSLKAAKHVVDTLEAENPNPIQLNAARDILDRAGIKHHEDTEDTRPIVKANIFILPEKRYNELLEATVIDHE